MPQDSLRSAVHRCLTKTIPVGFEDGNETVQCGTSRRSMTSLSVASEPMDGRGRRGPDLMPFKGKEEEVTAYQEDGELQLLQVFTGARKLNQMIGSWSKAPNLDGRWNYFAEDLLRSAVDLQESLIMLNKLQNASKLMSRMNRKQKQEFIYKREQELEQENHFGPLCSQRFAGGSYHNRLQEPRLSVDGSSRNLIGELKEVIGDSLYRQNLLSLSSDDEKASSSKSLRYSPSKGYRDKPSEQKVEVVGSVLASDQTKKPKASNLIAKLMGLEEVSSETVQPIKKEEKGKSINSPRYSLDTERPKARKRQSGQQIPDPKRKTLNNETVHFKGIFKSNQIEDCRFQHRFFDTPRVPRYARHFYRDDVPPIMIVNSLHLPCLERGEVQKELTLERVTVKEQRRSTKLFQEERASHQTTNMVTKILERKQVKPRGKTKEKPTPNVKAIDSSCQKQQRKEASKAHKKPNGKKKPQLLNERKQEEKKNVKATKVSTSHPNTSTEPAKSDRRLPAARNIASTQISTSQNLNLKCSSKSLEQNFSDSTKEKKIAGAKPVKRSNIVKANDDKKSKEDGKVFYSHNKMDNVSTTSSSFSGDELPEQADQGAKPCNRDDTTKTQNVLCEVIGKTNRVQKISELEAAAIQLPEKKATIGEAAAIEDDLKLLFLSSQSFLNRAQELFHVDAIRPVCYQNKGKDEVGKRKAKLLLDIAEELMVCKSHQQKHWIHSSVQTNLWGGMVYHSLDELVEEISNEISELTDYNTVDDNATADCLYIRLERDLKCKDAMLNAMWDFRWVNWICMEDTSQIVGELGEHILACLIEEAATGLVY
uniref:Uncharacterized protein LOC105048293 n=1 Tax=Elaeis guineensis var. tenera TaxID=51953 RepID=A0A6I9RFL1_ELAGV|nr:uncharacterized protein LOC105048293 [Elaeis guineensis]XP_029121356.1 uncharacterized protein LOC105048293 [Elaeis guineensis]XP_029121357.1 uncharacterized protein LOC105048293 [Elaeis guineensis]